MAEPWTVLEFHAPQVGGYDPAAVEVLSLRGEEALSEPFHYVVELTCPDPGFDSEVLDQLLVEPCSVTWGPTGENAVHGVVDRIEVGSVEAGRPVHYRLHIEPKLARLHYAVRSRVFQEMTVGEMLASVLAEHGLDTHTQIALTETYPKSEYTVQYRESDLAFIQRLMEHNGIHYHFQHEPGADAALLIVADSNAGLSHSKRTVPYAPRQAAHLDHEAVHTLSRELGVGSSTVLLTDYNWRSPRVSLTNQAQADTATGYGVFHEHGNHYKTPAEGGVLARARAERIVSERLRYQADVTLFGMTAGHVFHLAEHPSGDCAYRDYLVVRRALEIAGGGAGVYRDRLTLADPSHPYRPPRKTPKPRIYGIIHGVIDGAAHSTAAPIDDDGRYTVLLPFDLNGKPGGRASRRMRVAQPSSGPGFGVHLPMHIGAEVAIAHLDGDPDRPVIVGSVHNADTKNPVHAGNATKSWIQTQAGVRILFDDDVH